VDGIPDADLFFVDTAPGEAAKPDAQPLSKKLRNRTKLLRSQVILQSTQAVKPVVQRPAIKKKKAATTTTTQTNKATQQQIKLFKRKKTTTQTEEPVDIWQENNKVKPSKRQRQYIASQSNNNTAITTTTATITTRRAVRPTIKAVEIDHPGCSYNPDPELHQEAIAVAVAAEMKKVYDRELAPTAPPLTIINTGHVDDHDEMALLQTLEEEEEEEEEGSDSDDDVVVKKRGTERKTLKERNKEKRKRQAVAEEARKAEEKHKRREMANFKQLKSQVEEEIVEKQAKTLRRQLDRAERAASQPAKLGKHKFEPMSLQVLTTDEVQGGSLLKLKPTAAIIKERYKSLQRRGVIEPRKKIHQKKKSKKVVFQTGERQERALERQEDMKRLRRGGGK
jgi:nucleolar protein 53